MYSGFSAPRGRRNSVPTANGPENAQLLLAEQLRSVRRQLGQIMSQFAKIKFPAMAGNFSGGVGGHNQPPRARATCPGGLGKGKTPSPSAPGAAKLPGGRYVAKNACLLFSIGGAGAEPERSAR
jgi:hypothetical protein